MSARFLVPFALLALGLHRTGLSADARAEVFDPKPKEISNYEQIWKRSPFIVETVSVAQSPGLATKYALVGLVGSGSDSMAFLVDRNEGDPTKSRLMLSQKSPDKARNLELVSISIDKDIRKSSVMIKQGNEQATLPFDQSTLANAGIGVPGAGMGAGSPIPPPPGNVIMPPPPSMNVPSIRPPQPGQMIQAPSAVPNPTGEQTPPTPTRRIIRPKPINVN